MQQENDLENKIRDIEEQIHREFVVIDEHTLESLKKYKQELESLRETKIKGIMLRTKVTWLDSGEKPSKYFLNLENRNYTNKLIPKIIRDSGEEIFKQDEILKEQRAYYENLYSDKNRTDRAAIREHLSKLKGPKLGEDLSEELEGYTTMQELAEAPKSMKNNKSPGLDGFSAEFFKFLWTDLR